MTTAGAILRLARLGWVLAREGVVSALPDEGLPASVRLAKSAVGLLARNRAKDSTRSDNLARAVERLGPGSRGRVSRFGLSDDLKVYVEVDAQGNPGTPPQMDLKPGLTVVRVTQDADLPTGKMHMTRVEE